MELTDIVFAIDSILVAVAMSPKLWVIITGGLLGIVAMRLTTDTQHMAYVPREGESSAPAGLARAFAVGNRLQDIVVAELRPGRTGNEVLRASLARMKADGIDGTVYSHPVGLHGHGAGTEPPAPQSGPDQLLRLPRREQDL